MQDSYPTKGLRERDFRSGNVISLWDEPKAEYLWDAGIAISRFLEGLQRGRIIGRSCAKCRRTMVPPRMFCEWCWRPTDRWVTLRDTGVVNTFSICHVRWDMERLDKPEIPAVIEIDGASEGMGIMHLLDGVAPKRVHIGMRVKAVWKPESEREGAITDILHFKPVAEKSRTAGPANRAAKRRAR